MMEHAAVSQVCFFGGAGDLVSEGDTVIIHVISAGEQIKHRWSLWQENDMATREKKDI